MSEKCFRKTINVNIPFHFIYYRNVKINGENLKSRKINDITFRRQYCQ